MTYNNLVLVGNWAEERLKNEHEFKIFLRKRERRELLLQKSRTLFSNLLKEKSLAISGKFVLYGYNVQVVASDIPAKPKVAGAMQKNGLAMSILVRERQVDYMQNISDGCLMTLSPILTPCCRNSFIIVSAWDDNKRGDQMKYGDEFLLQAENYADPKTGARLIIKNLVADKSLCVMNQNWMQTFFGAECGVNCANYIDIHGRNTAENIFTLISDVETKTKY
ncbi:hypothetical protein PYW07_007764 [Mythimna separata]|uniref:Uncharacterized protein n=1 Tax=Mythimna separata TaxID=271217 RepID=A0AAD8DU80_MYTSE|nr:hypothetical protein PYW07_007764 [Mythimna separata]